MNEPPWPKTMTLTHPFAQFLHSREQLATELAIALIRGGACDLGQVPQRAVELADALTAELNRKGDDQ